jgi:uncharacterized protein (DUF1330 family)
VSSYIIANINIHDRAGYARYEEGFMDIFQQFNGKMLSVDENQQVLEGDWPVTRTVLIEFPTDSDAMAWYRSEGYQALMQHRLNASVGNIALVAGLETQA